MKKILMLIIIIMTLAFVSANDIECDSNLIIEETFGYHTLCQTTNTGALLSSGFESEDSIALFAAEAVKENREGETKKVPLTIFLKNCDGSEEWENYDRKLTDGVFSVCIANTNLDRMRTEIKDLNNVRDNSDSIANEIKRIFISDLGKLNTQLDQINLEDIEGIKSLRTQYDKKIRDAKLFLLGNTEREMETNKIKAEMKNHPDLLKSCLSTKRYRINPQKGSNVCKVVYSDGQKDSIKPTFEELECEGYLEKLTDAYTEKDSNWNEDPYLAINAEYPGCEDSEELMLSVSYFKNILRLNELERTIFTKHTELGKLGSFSLLELNKKLEEKISSEDYSRVDSILDDRWYLDNEIDKDLRDNLANIYFLERENELTWRADLVDPKVIQEMKVIADELNDEGQIEKLKVRSLELFLDTNEADFYEQDFVKTTNQRYDNLINLQETLKDSIDPEVKNDFESIRLIQSEGLADNNRLKSTLALYQYRQMNDLQQILDNENLKFACDQLNQGRQGPESEKCNKALEELRK